MSAAEDRVTAKLFDSLKPLEDDGSNYSTWKFRQLQIFESRGLLGHIEGTTKMPATSSTEYDGWVKNERSAKMQITMHVGEEVLRHVMDQPSSVDMWKAILIKFGGKGAQSAANLIYTICRSTLDDDKDMSTQINEFKENARKLANIGYSLQDAVLAVMLINALPPSYSTVRTVLTTSVVSAITIDSVIETILAEEVTRKGLNANAFKARVDSKSKQKSKGKGSATGEKPKCTNPKCGKIGHTIQNCWAEGGGAEGKGPKSKSGTKNDAKTGESKLNEVKAKVAQIEEVSVLFARVGDESVSLAEKDFRKFSTKDWILDSGATRHVTNDQNALITFTKLTNPIRIWMADHHYIYAVGVGNVYMDVLVNEKKSRCLFKDVLLAPKMAGNLVSIRQLAKNGFKTLFYDEVAKISDKHGHVKVEAKIRDDLYKVQGYATNDEEGCMGRVVDEDREGEVSQIAHIQNSTGTLNLWHRRLGHLNEDDVLRMYRKGMVEGMKIIPQSIQKKTICESCLKGKHAREPIPKETDTRATEILHRIHSDLCDAGESRKGYRYYVTFIDDYSRYTEVIPLKRKDETLEAFKKFVARAENETGKRIIRFRSDGGGEFYSKEFIAYCDGKGIAQEKTNPDTPQKNGVAERKNQTLNNKARSMLADANLTTMFWESAIQYANWIINRSPSRALDDNKTPYELYYNKKPSLTTLRVFGCKVWVQIPKKHRAKFDNRTVECIFLGFTSGKRAFIAYDRTNRRVIESRDVKFEEGRDKERIVIRDEDDDEDWTEDETSTQEEQEEGNDDEPDGSGGEVDTENHRVASPTEENSDNSDVQDSSVPSPPLRRSTRIRRPPTPDDDPKYSVGSRKTLKETTPSVNPKDDETENVDHAALMSTLEPQSYRDAMRREDASSWMDAMAKEMESQNKAETYIEVPRPRDVNILESRWVYAYKLGADGQNTIYKARLVAKGFKQRPGEDFNETFAPTMHKSSLLTLLAIAAQEDLEIEHLDIKTAFLNGDLEEEIYMHPPEGFPPQKAGNVWKLMKSIYGLKQAARMWYKKFKSSLDEMGFQRTNSDHAVFIRRSGGFACVAFHVDDTLSITRSETMKIRVKDEISQHFETKDLGKVKLFCGFEITRDRSARTITVGQERYNQIILERFGLENARPVTTPMAMNLQLEKLDNPTIDVHLYQSMLGSLMYAAVGTRPDISFAVNTLAQHASAPGEEHLCALKRIFQYLIGTKKLQTRIQWTYERSYSHRICRRRLGRRRQFTSFNFRIRFLSQRNTNLLDCQETTFY